MWIGLDDCVSFEFQFNMYSKVVRIILLNSLLLLLSLFFFFFFFNYFIIIYLLVENISTILLK